MEHVFEVTEQISRALYDRHIPDSLRYWYRNHPEELERDVERADRQMHVREGDAYRIFQEGNEGEWWVREGKRDGIVPEELMTYIRQWFIQYPNGIRPVLREKKESMKESKKDGE